MSFLTTSEIKKIGFKYVGKNVSISNKASIYHPENITILDNSRIDDFVVLSAGDGGISIGKNVHLAVFTSLIGKGKIEIGDYANFSSRVSVYSSNDDYSGSSMTNPTLNPKYTGVEHEDVFIGKHVIVGCGSVILPGAKIFEGVAIGALSLLKRGIYKEFCIYGGVPARYIKLRLKDLLEIEKLIDERN